MDEYKIEPGSFRDRNGRVFYGPDAVYRTLSAQAFKEWENLTGKAFFKKYHADGRIVSTEQVSLELEKLPFEILGEEVNFLKHDKIPFLSYPYEWSFGMLKDIALFQLELISSALEEDMILKDSSAYNFQWDGSRPVFIDIPSFETLRPGEPWVGYRQFCQMFLYPLFLQAYKDVPFHPWIRGDIEGMEVEHFNKLMSFRDLFRPGVFTNAFLHSKFQTKYSQSNKNIKHSLQQIGFYKQLISRNVNKLNKIVSKLKWSRKKSQWSDYSETHNYDDRDFKEKTAFVEQVINSENRWSLVWDLGCNTGFFSRIASKNAEYTISMDADHMAVEQLYQNLKQEKNRSILPLCMSLNNPSPDQGWRGQERKNLLLRGAPDLTLCLALVHHMVITANIPLEEFVKWLAGLGTSLIIEFVTKDDEMVKTLLRNKIDQYADYEIDFFERCLNSSFKVIQKAALQNGTRFLYYARVN
jgi:hypothetical protein